MVHPQALVTTIPGSLKPESRDPETETGNLETEKRVHRIHGTLEPGLDMIPRSLVAPTRGAGGFVFIWHLAAIRKRVRGIQTSLCNFTS